MKTLYADAVLPNEDLTPARTTMPSVRAGPPVAGLDAVALTAINAALETAFDADQDAVAQTAIEEAKKDNAERSGTQAEPDMPECGGCVLWDQGILAAGWYWCPWLGNWGIRHGCPVPKGPPPMSPADYESLVFAMATAGLGGTAPSADAERCGDMVARWPSTGAMARTGTGRPAAATATPACQVAEV